MTAYNLRAHAALSGSTPFDVYMLINEVDIAEVRDLQYINKQKNLKQVSIALDVGECVRLSASSHSLVKFRKC